MVSMPQRDSPGGFLMNLRDKFWQLFARIADAFQVLGLQGMLTMAGSFALPAWAAIATDWLNAYGPIAWVASGFAGLILFVVALFIWAQFRVNTESARIVAKHRQDPDPLNPLADNFERKRIRLHDLASVIDRTVDQKTFDRCELIGPACVVIVDSITMQDNHFYGCDFVICRNGAAINNAITLRRCTIQRSKLHGITFLIPRAAANNPGLAQANWITENPPQAQLSQAPA